MSTILRPCPVFSDDRRLLRTVKSALRELAEPRPCSDSATFLEEVRRLDPVLALVDLRSPSGPELATRFTQTFPNSILIAFAGPRTRLWREADEAIFALLDPASERENMRSFFAAALRHLALLEEKSVRAPRPSSPGSTHASQATPSRPASLTRFRLDPHAAGRPEELLKISLGQLAAEIPVFRAGIFLASSPGGEYKLAAGINYPPAAPTLSCAPDHPLPRILADDAKILMLSQCSSISPPAHARAVRDIMKSIGADLIAPVLGENGLAGWIFLSPPATGRDWNEEDLRGIVAFCGIMAAHAHNFATSARNLRHLGLLDSVLRLSPVGIIAADSNARIRWINPVAARILELDPALLENRPVENLGARVADLLRRTIEQQAPEPLQWKLGEKQFQAETRRLTEHEDCTGAVLFLREITVHPPPQAAPPRGEQPPPDFWAGLAASMSHQIRNPLVAIKTFSQLLPERHDDPEFRTEFGRIVEQEIEHLDSIVTNINKLARPLPRHFRKTDLTRAVKRGLNLALVRRPVNGVRIEIALPDDLPAISADEKALADCFAEIFLNALEAVMDSPSPHIRAAGRVTRMKDTVGAEIAVRDNGPGIAPEIRSEIFSPFCSTRARGMGLGLPLARRIILAHKGNINISSGRRGTTVTVTLPLQHKPVEVTDETSAHS